MSVISRTMSLVAAGGIALSALTGMSVSSASAKDIVIRMAGPDWGPTRFMQELANKEYKAKSGNNVKLELDFIPWGSFYDRVAASLSSGEKKYQMIISDSQWLGAFIDGGHFAKLNKYIDKDPELQAIMKDLHPAFVKAFSAYPKGSKDYYGFPQFPDSMPTWYRKDLFCNAKEQAAFRKTYTRPLPCTYADWRNTDWKDWGNIGKFFTRKKGAALGDGVAANDFYGTAYQAGKTYDFSTSQINTFMWQWGGDIWENGKQAQGVVNSNANVEAFNAYLGMLKNSPPAWKTGQMGIFAIQDQFMQGNVAAIIDWAGVAGPVLDPKSSKVHDKVAFASNPGKRQKNGIINRTAQIGGQPFVLTTWNDEEVMSEALDVVKWWLSTDVQKKFVEAGYLSGLKSVMAWSGHDKARPWNRSHREVVDHLKDFWRIPEMFELLTQQQQEFDKAITGQVSAKEALDEIAEFQQELLEDAGHIKK